MNMSTDQNTTRLSQVVSPSTSAVSWGAVIAGAVAAAAMSLILLILGMGLGLSSVSPWTHSNTSGETLGIASILWIFFASFVASGLGGYIAGRLRTKWLSVPIDEVYFRDTAHGFLAWAIATLGTAILLTTVIGKILVAGAQTGVSVAGNMAGAATVAGVSLTRDNEGANQGTRSGLDYIIDVLFRRNFDQTISPAAISNPAATTGPDPAQATPEIANEGNTGTSPPDEADNAPADTSPGAAEETDGTNAAAGPQVFTAPRIEEQQTVPLTPPRRSTEDARTEITHILIQSIRNGSLAQEDIRYAGRVLADAIDVEPQAAEQRLNEAFTAVREAETAAREMADDIRAASAKTALWLFISLLIGAFIASMAATFGGRQRDM